MPRGKLGVQNSKVYGISITNKKLQDKMDGLKKKQCLSQQVQDALCKAWRIE